VMSRSAGVRWGFLRAIGLLVLPVLLAGATGITSQLIFPDSGFWIGAFEGFVAGVLVSLGVALKGMFRSRKVPVTKNDDEAR
jgi:hypothetical protein